MQPLQRPAIFSRRHCAAFSLLELAIALGAIGLMVGIALQFKPEDTSQQCYQQTRADLAVMQNAVTKYAQMNRHYPLPAGNTSAGRSVTTIPSANTTVEGVSTSTDGKVVSGRFPYTTLGLTERYARDCFNNGDKSYYRYMASVELTDTAQYETHLGQANTNVGVLVKNKANDAGKRQAYALLSHGLSGCKGAAAPNCDALSSEVQNYAFNNTASDGNLFDAVVAVKDFDFQSCSGRVHWNGATSDPNAPTEACWADIPASQPLSYGNSITQASISTAKGSASITCGRPDGVRKNGLSATGSCGG